MKIIHTADWHLGNTFHRHNREAEHKYFLKWLLNVLKEENADALLVCGDVFDSSNPSASAERLFYNFLQEATEYLPGLQIVIIAGNHDSAARIEAPSSILHRQNVYVRGLLSHTAEGMPNWAEMMIPLGERDKSVASCTCVAIPFLRTADLPAGKTLEEGLRQYFQEAQRYVRKSDYKRLPCIAMRHLYAQGAEISDNEHSERLVVGGQDMVSCDVAGKGFAYIALGHIHKAQCVDSNLQMYYAGSVLPMSFSETHYTHGVQVIEIEADGSIAVARRTYNPLRSLLTIPKKGNATPDEILSLLGELPTRDKNDDEDTWPYLEIRILADRPTPELLNDVTQMLQKKAVHFCRMVAQHVVSTNENPQHIGLEHLRTFSPLQMAEAIYKERYGTTIPEPMRKRFGQVLSTLQENQ